MTDRDLYNLCQGYGKIISTKAILDPATNTCKGYGFVDFETAAAAEAAVKYLQASGMQAQMARQQERDVTNLYIANLAVHISETDLKSMFSRFGQVVSTRILRDPHGFSRGVGFVRMESKDRCEAIIQAFNGKLLPRHTEPLLVKFADGGNRKRAQFGSRGQWVDRPTSESADQQWRYDQLMLMNITTSSYDQSAPQNGLNNSLGQAQTAAATATVLTSPPILQHGYSLAAAAPPVNHPQTYQQLPTAGAWVPHPAAVSAGTAPYLVQHPMTTVISNLHPQLHTIDPNLLSAHMNQLYITAAASSTNNEEQTTM
jgi:hypothetical protein